MYHPLSLNGYSKIINAVKRQRNLGLVVAMLDLTGNMIIWGGLFAHGDGSTGLMKVVFCYALPTVVQGFGANETLHFRTTTLWVQLPLGVGV
jgi:hypothetical protein